MAADKSSPRRLRQFQQQFYKCGAWISDEIEVAVADAAYSRPTGSLIPMFHRVEGAERRRVVAGVIRDLAKVQGVDRRMTKLCYDLFVAIGRVRSIAGSRKSQLLLSHECKLSIRQVVALSRRSEKAIIRELESLNQQANRPRNESTRRRRSVRCEVENLATSQSNQPS
jgi:hypothetical protein